MGIEKKFTRNRPTVAPLYMFGIEVTFILYVHNLDTEAPPIVCPMKITVETDPGVCSTNGSFSDMVYATDNCDPDPTITCSPMSGSTFNTSGDIVTCMAEDGSGNVGYCNFSVIVAGIIASLFNSHS